MGKPPLVKFGNFAWGIFLRRDSDFDHFTFMQCSKQHSVNIEY